MRLLLIFLSFLPLLSYGSHLRAGEITVQQVDCSSIFRITLTIYVNTATATQVGDGILDFGDGTQIITTSKAAALIDTYNNVGKVVFTFDHSYANAGTYKISYSEPNRNGGISNIPNSVSTRFELETQIIVAQRCNNSAQFLIAPVDRACVGKIFYHDPGAFDPDGDSLSYEITTPGTDRGQTVSGYSFPNDAMFYPNGNYSTANEAENGLPVFNLDPLTGLLKWDAPGMIGEFTVAFKVIEWRKDPQSNLWNSLGYVIRDMQIIVEDCSNNRPVLIVPGDICVEAGQTIDMLIKGSDPDLDNVKIEVFSSALNENDVSLHVLHTGEVQSGANAQANLQWTTNCNHARNEFYEFIFKITDLPLSGTRLVDFKKVRIKVIAPAPQIASVEVNPVNKTARLNWEMYFCDAVTIQVWRRVAKYPYDQPECKTGMPKFLGYTLLKELPPDATDFTDTDLNIGAQYCYRLITKLQNKINTYSRLSEDVCLIPLPAKAPVITNVSVTQTSTQNGSVQVKWRRPFEIDPNQYPEPYYYEVWRSTGLTGESYTRASDMIADTLFNDTGLNTLETAYHYKVLVYVPALTPLPVDTSSTASSVFTTSESQSNNIKLKWKAKVPWANNLQKHPWHYIYRGDEGLDGTFHLLDSILVDSINVNEEDFHYTDARSNANPFPLGKKFFYKIQTTGGYGNPRINEPLFNFSQIVEGHIKDTIPPDAPIVQINNLDCEQNIASYSCDTRTFTNSISWLESTQDVDHYIISVADSVNGDFVTLNSNLVTYSYSHANIKKLAFCYRIKAIDRDGNESEWSDPVCNDNCPYIELPNVFTPGNDDGFNDYFASVHCPIAVKAILFKVFDRSGHEVYAQRIQDNVTKIWDGRDNNQKELPAGVYFYSATTEFDVINPKTAQKNIRGWVQLVR
jgi:hypothetical protein